MAGPMRSADTQPSQKPPRPPNAWIIYRSDKVRELPPPPPGDPRRAQAQVSKMISAMWRNESDAVRGEYERRAEAKKAEHYAMYPNYRFQPVKKEDKERIREEKRAEKERDRALSRRSRARPAPYATGYPAAPSMVYPAPIYNPAVRYGPAGPSPPLSAASSPENASPYPESQPEDQSQSSGSSSHASSSSAAYPSSNIDPALSSAMAPSSYSGAMPLFYPPQPQNGMVPPNAYQLPVPVPSSHPQPAQQEQPVYSTMSGWPDFQSQPPLEGFNQPDFVSLNVPNFASQPLLQGWSPNDGDQYQALATGDPSIFQLDGFDYNSLLADPEGEIEVSMGSQLPSFATDLQSQQFAELFKDFDFSSIKDSSPSLQDNQAGINPTQILAQPDNASTSMSTLPPSFFTGDNVVAESPASPSTGQRDFGSFSSNDTMFQFFDMEGAMAASQEAGPSSRPQPTHVHSMPLPEQTAQTPYVPPAGAVHSSNRRVAASWKPSFASSPESSPIEHNGSTPWVPTQI